MKELELTEKCYALRSRILGEEHSATMVTLSNLAICYKDLGNYAAALPLFEKLYTLRCKHLGADNTKTQRALKNLQLCKEKLSEK